MGKTNGYLIFAIEYKKKYGLHHYGFREMLETMSPFWEKLPDKEKQRYKERALAENKRHALKRSNKSSTPNEIEQKRLKLVNEDEEKRKKIENLVYSLNDLADLDDYVFHFISISTYFEDDNDIYPAELSIAKFSLKRGLIDDIHIKINPGKLPCGALFLANEKSAKTHQYLVPPSHNDDLYDDSYGETSYILILLKIIEFLNPADELPIFFTEQSTLTNTREMLNAQRALATIFEKGGEYEIASKLNIYSIVDLFYYLNKVVVAYDSSNEAFLSLAMADDAFKRTETMFQNAVRGCDFHESIDKLRHCCLAKIKCYAYIISKFCANADKYPLIEGKHYPKGYQLTV